jgi:protein phosphatase 1 regulatory subunit 11
MAAATSPVTTTEDCGSTTITIIETDQPVRAHSPTLILELHRPTEAGPRVRWTEETVDNEYMNKKKSKCCCIYTKPHDPSTEDNKNTELDEYDNCQHCRYHTETDYAAKPEERQPKIKLVIGQPKIS